MTRTHIRRQLSLTAALSTVLITLTAAFAVTPARANTRHPANCDPYVIEAWYDTCWQGHNYINAGTSVLGVQYVLIGQGISPGTPDCEFGPRTDRAVILYQRAHGLLPDGIVGPRTWTSLQGNLWPSGLFDTWGTYWNNGPHDGLRFYYNFFGGRGYWFILTPWYPDGSEYVAMTDYTGIFCP